MGPEPSAPKDVSSRPAKADARFAEIISSEWSSQTEDSLKSEPQAVAKLFSEAAKAAEAGNYQAAYTAASYIKRLCHTTSPGRNEWKEADDLVKQAATKALPGEFGKALELSKQADCFKALDQVETCKYLGSVYGATLSAEQQKTLGEIERASLTKAVPLMHKSFEEHAKTGNLIKAEEDADKLKQFSDRLKSPLSNEQSEKIQKELSASAPKYIQTTIRQLETMANNKADFRSIEGFIGGMESVAKRYNCPLTASQVQQCGAILHTAATHNVPLRISEAVQAFQARDIETARYGAEEAQREAAIGKIPLTSEQNAQIDVLLGRQTAMRDFTKLAMPGRPPKTA